MTDAVIISCLYWAVTNASICVCFSNPAKMVQPSRNAGNFLLTGVAPFAPDAPNQSTSALRK